MVFECVCIVFMCFVLIVQKHYAVQAYRRKPFIYNSKQMKNKNEVGAPALCAANPAGAFRYISKSL